MLTREASSLESVTGQLAVQIARSTAEVREAQRLRYSVFAEEMGAQLSGPEPGVDEDRFDRYCEHLVVRDLASGEVVGTYRILAPSAAQAAGGYYSEQEFDIGRLAHLRAGLVELGRSCIHADFRTGAVITALWSGLARYMRASGCTHVVGCASMSMSDGGRAAANLYRQIERCHLSPLEYRVFPHVRLPLERLVDGARAVLPPLLKGYLRLGASVCGEPAWDPDFNTADVFVVLPLSRLDARYARRFMGDARPGVLAAAALAGQRGGRSKDEGPLAG
jgi:putative hemolysin